ncbi:LysR family transcriptional regulator [Melghirimyces algeriensis]|uniref:Regulatory helix-turn-helix protein, lysR family n=1 Tax=Melghirimyces algeriensis TaxID=910412 RepID=A0A521D565_9BACL|nr:LysR family transcriptional regulator [Melghirimyces algeriensis]SMO66817.1 regulatory helix-turn-helix protein, lysR family [Melghirimyces algeriensis]
MEIYQLRYFLTIVKCKNFTKAAKQLHITQPALSKQMKCLEEEMRQKLLLRTRKGVQLTPEGKLLKKHAETILMEVEKVNQYIKKESV